MNLEFNFVKKELFNLPEIDRWGFDPEDSIPIESHWTMANIAVIMELFPSVTMAKKNGWNGPIPPGYTEKKRLGKYKKSLYIHNPPNDFINNPEWGKVNSTEIVQAMHNQAQELIERTMAYTLRPTKNDRASVIIEVLDFAIDMEKEEILKLIEELRGIANA